MKTKDRLIERIRNIQDETILEELLEMVEVELNLSDEIVELSSEQKAAIDQGLKDLEECRTYSNNEAQKIIDEWMKKR